MYQSLRLSDTLVLDTCVQDLELLSSKDNRTDLYHRLNSLEMLKKEHKEVMLDLQKWPMDICYTLNKCKQLRKENKPYR